jgi:hypothetical protein
MSHTELKSKVFGHEVYCLEYPEGKFKDWRYADTDTLVSDCQYTRLCFHCRNAATDKEHDPCIADLEGVTNACCGHGVEKDAYVSFDDDRQRLDGMAAIAYFRSQGAYINER